MHMGIDHRGLEIAMPKQSLDGSDVGSFSQVSRERVTQRLYRRMLANDCHFLRLLEAGLLVDSEAWHRRARPVSGRRRETRDGKRYCHPRALEALGYFPSRVPGVARIRGREAGHVCAGPTHA
jgi:hypothetical protein